MKKLIILSTLVTLLMACNRPQKLLEKGKYEKAFQSSSQRLSRGKIKTKDINTFEESFNYLMHRDSSRIAALKAKGNPKVWLDIHHQIDEIATIDRKAQKVSDRLLRKGHFTQLNFLPIKDWQEEADRNVALYYYEEGQELVPEAEQGDKLAARRAHKNFVEAQKYKADLLDAHEMEKRMFAKGTINLLLEPLDTDLGHQVADQLFNSFIGRVEFPKRQKWNVYHLIEPQNVEMDYALDFYFGNLHDGAENISEDICTNTTSIVVGCETKKVWSEQDSAYIEITETIYRDVSVTVSTVRQEKRASLKLFCEVIDLKSQALVERLTLSGSDCWSNKFSNVWGDRRALDFFSCSDEGGVELAPPSAMSLWRNSATGLKRPFYRKINKKLTL
jgi:hypothetical protein